MALSKDHGRITFVTFLFASVHDGNITPVMFAFRYLHDEDSSTLTLCSSVPYERIQDGSRLSPIDLGISMWKSDSITAASSADATNVIFVIVQSILL